MQRLHKAKWDEAVRNRYSVLSCGSAEASPVGATDSSPARSALAKAAINDSGPVGRLSVVTDVSNGRPEGSTSYLTCGKSLPQSSAVGSPGRCPQCWRWQDRYRTSFLPQVSRQRPQPSPRDLAVFPRWQRKLGPLRAQRILQLALRR